jgi:hypothetical protein
VTGAGNTTRARLIDGKESVRIGAVLVLHGLALLLVVPNLALWFLFPGTDETIASCRAGIPASAGRRLFENSATFPAEIFCVSPDAPPASGLSFWEATSLGAVSTLLVGAVGYGIWMMLRRPRGLAREEQPLLGTPEQTPGHEHSRDLVTAL